MNISHSNPEYKKSNATSSCAGPAILHKAYGYTLFLSLLITIACNNKTVVRAQRKNIVETVYASGKIVADSEYTVYALSAGYVMKKLIKEGDTVKKGQILYIVNYDASSAKLHAAQTNYDEASSNISEKSRVLNDLKLAMDNARTKLNNDSLLYARRSKLWQQGIGTQNDVDNASANYITSRNLEKSAEEKYYATHNDLNVSLANAKSQLAGAQTDLNNYFIKSGNNGMVYQTYKEQGEAVKLNDAVALLGKTSKRLIRMAVDQQDIDKVKLGQDVLLKTDITGNAIYHAMVSKIYPMMNEADQTFRVDAWFSDSSRQHFTHSSVEANIIIQKKSDVLTVPRLAMIADDSLMIRVDGKTKIVSVQTGIRTLEEVEIVSGINQTSEIILPAQK
ncbi:MAG TPA: efflux RND transporter periplasmic adaptor subunit [Puia sp.]|jgi:HlyD family secretion protein|nr:efflux RND transporter periplasmic adaptor subunit [Puia sp.]